MRQCSQSGVQGIGQAQLTQCTEYRGLHEWVRISDPFQQHVPGGHLLEFREALSRSEAHRFIAVEKSTAQRATTSAPSQAASTRAAFAADFG